MSRSDELERALSKLSALQFFWIGIAKEVMTQEQLEQVEREFEEMVGNAQYFNQLFTIPAEAVYLPEDDRWQ